MKKLNQKGFTAAEGLVVVMILLVVGGIGYYVWHSQKKPTVSTATTTAVKSTTPVAATSVDDGTITGEVSYPSSGLPPETQACAISVSDSSKVYCDKVGERQPSNNCNIEDTKCVPPVGYNKYSVKVPAGEYYVYAVADKHIPNYKAYYNEISKCGADTSCQKLGHESKIKITVAANATVSGINPGDWYPN